ncbi:MAG: hypothetical protein WAS36_02960 [Candidatus Saccharimonadales bacterium]
MTHANASSPPNPGDRALQHIVEAAEDMGYAPSVLFKDGAATITVGLVAYELGMPFVTGPHKRAAQRVGRTAVSKYVDEHQLQPLN